MIRRGRLVVPVVLSMALLSPGGSATTADNPAEPTLLPESAPVTAIGAAWSPRGPAPTLGGQTESIRAALGEPISNQVVGAIHAVVAHPTSDDILYVGTVNGGIWKTTNATTPNPTWIPQTDDLDSLSIGGLAMDPLDSDHLVAAIGNISSFNRIGGPLGSILQTYDGGTTWNEIKDPLIDDQDFSGIVVRGNTIMASSLTAANPVGDSLTVIRSADGGATWSKIGGVIQPGPLPAAEASDIVADPSDPNRYYVALMGMPIYMTGDSGVSWIDVSASDANLSNVLSQATTSTLGNIELAVATTGRLFVGAIVGGQPDYIGYTDDQGAAWTPMELPDIINGSGLITDATNATPIVITSAGHGLGEGDDINVFDVTGNTNANGSHIVTFDAAGITNALDEFALKNTSGNADYTGDGFWVDFDSISPGKAPGSQGDQHFSIAADPSDQTIVYVGGDRQDNASVSVPNFIGARNATGNLWRGVTTEPVGTFPSLQWSHLTHATGITGIANGGTGNETAPHADSRDITFNDSGKLIEVDDGGIYLRTLPKLNTGDWFSLNGNLQVSELHSIAYDTVSDVLFAGAQDTGTPEQIPLDPPRWNDLSGGDGGDVATGPAADPMDSLRYHSNQLLSTFRVRLCDPGGFCVHELSPGLNLASGDFDAQFLTPLELHPADVSRLAVAGRGGVYESTDRGDNLNLISGDDAHPVDNAIALSYGHPLNLEAVYAVSGPSTFFPSKVFVRGAANTDLQETAIGYPGHFGRDIVMDPLDWETAYVVDDSAIYRINDQGASCWDNLTNNLGSDGASNFRAMEYVQAGGGDRLVVGTNKGVYISQSPFDCWFELGTELPNAPVFDLDYDPADDLLAVATMGRGAWTLTGVAALAMPACEIDLTVTITEILDTIPVGGTALYSIVVGNAGPLTATGVLLDINLEGVSSTVSSATPTQGSCTGSGPVICDLEEIAKDDFVLIDFQVIGNEAGALRVDASNSAIEFDADAGNDQDFEVTLVDDGAACTVWFDGGPNGDNPFWNVAENWSSDLLPTASDNVCIPAGFAGVGISATGGAANRVISDSPFGTVGPLNLGALSIIDETFSLGVTGSLTGNGRLILESGMTWDGAGSISLLGGIEIVDGESLDIDGTRFYALNGSFIDNYGLMSCCGTVGLSGSGGAYIEIFPGGSLTHDTLTQMGVLIMNGGTLNLVDTADTGHVITTGTVNIFGQADVRGIEIESPGAVLLGTGNTLKHRVGIGSMSGAGSSLTGAGDVLFEQSSFTINNGTYDVEVTEIGANGQVSVGNGIVAKTGTLVMDAQLSQLTGAGTMEVAGLFTFGASTMSGTGLTDAQGGVDIDQARILERTLKNRTVANLISNSSMSIGDGGVIDNLIGATFNFVDSADILEAVGSAVPGVFNNIGTVTKTGSVSSSVGAAFNNTGTVNVADGSFRLEKGGSLGGTFNLMAGNSILRLTGGTFGFSGATVGPGTLEIDGAIVNFDGLVMIGGYLEASDGVMEFDIGGVVAGAGYDQVVVEEEVFLNTSLGLNVNLVNGFIPKAGDWFRIIDGFLNDVFGTENLPVLPPGLLWKVDYQRRMVVLEVVASADLGMSAATNPVIASPGSPLTYTLTVQNGGPGPAPGVVLTSVLSGSNYTVSSKTPSQGICVGQSNIACGLGTIANGANASVIIVIVPTEVGAITNDIEVTTDAEDLTPVFTTLVTTVSQVVAIPDLLIRQDETSDPIGIGDSFDYLITVENIGMLAAPDVMLTETLAGAGVTVDAVVPSQGSCSGTSPIDCDLGLIPTLSDATVTISMTATAAGTLSGTALVTTSAFVLSEPENIQTTAINPPLSLLYGGAGNGATLAGAYYVLDPLTAAATLLGDAFDPGGLSGVEFALDGALYGSTVSGFPSTSNLVRISPGPPTIVGPIVVAATGEAISVADLAVQPDTGALFTIRSGADDQGRGGELYTIDWTTAAATRVGIGQAPGSWGGITFDGEGRLYQNNGSELWILNPMDGALLATMPVATVYDGLASRPEDNLLYATRGGGGGQVWTIDPSTGGPATMPVEIQLLPGPGDKLSDVVFEPSSRNAALQLDGGGNATWPGPIAAIGFDVVRVDLTTLRSTGGDYSAATVECLADDTTVTTAPLGGATPAAGQAFIYLQRVVGESGSLTYDSGIAGQPEGRDSGINAAAAACSGP